MSFLLEARLTRHHTFILAIAAAVAPIVVQPVFAQATLDSADHAAIARDSAAGLTWMLPSPRDWSRYAHPGQCVAAINIVQMSTVTRTSEHYPVAQHDTLSTAARTVGKACAGRFSINTVSPQDWRQFHKLALMLDDLSLAHAIVESQLARASTPDEKGSVVMDALANMNGRDPRQIAAADSLVERIATFGPNAKWWRVVALQRAPLAPAFDTTRWMRQQSRAEVEFKALSREDRLKTEFPGKYMANDWFAIQEFGHVAPAEMCAANKRGLLGLGTDTIRGNTAAMFWGATEASCQGEVETIGQLVRTLSGGQWFKVGDTVGTTSLGFPIPGHVTLVVTEPLGSGRITKNLAIYARLYRQYHEKGLDLVLVHRRQGFAWGSGLLTADNETQLMRWYDHDYLKLPFPIAIYDSSATDMPGRLLIGNDGRQFAGALGVDQFEPNESVLEAFVEQALGEPTKKPATSSSGAGVR